MSTATADERTPNQQPQVPVPTTTSPSDDRTSCLPSHSDRLGSLPDQICQPSVTSSGSDKVSAVCTFLNEALGPDRIHLDLDYTQSSST